MYGWMFRTFYWIGLFKTQFSEICGTFNHPNILYVHILQVCIITIHQHPNNRYDSIIICSFLVSWRDVSQYLEDMKNDHMMQCSCHQQTRMRCKMMQRKGALESWRKRAKWLVHTVVVLSHKSSSARRGGFVWQNDDGMRILLVWWWTGGCFLLRTELLNSWYCVVVLLYENILLSLYGSYSAPVCTLF